MNDTLRPSANARLGNNPLGDSVSMQKPGVWRHPWFTVAKWMPLKKAWCAFVVAGFVNGVAPMVRTTAGDLREARGTFFGQLADARTGAAELAQLALLAIGGSADAGLDDSASLDVPLYQNPPISMNEWRNIGWDGSAAVPQYFQDRGVSKPKAAASANTETGISINADNLTPPAGNRLLRACDIFLHQPRAALTSQISIEPGLLTGVSNVTQTLGVREQASGDTLKIQTGTYEDLQQDKLNFTQDPNLVASNYEEKNWDQIPVSTVYLMSPPDAAADAKPDATWQAFAQHNLFWNLSWAQPQLRTVITTDAFGALTATVAHLGSGAGSFAVNFIAASINDATQSAFNILTAQSLAGSFWTPTAGGTTSAYPATTAASTSSGLDKAAKAAAKAAAAAAAKRTRKLDPAFPYEGQKFNVALLK